MIKRREFIKKSALGTTGLAFSGMGSCSGHYNPFKWDFDEIEPIEAPFPMPQLQRPVFPSKVFDIRKYGAIGDGATKNTTAFNEAIIACSETGGGYVEVPEGKWLTGAIHLQSNVNLQLGKGAEIHFSDEPEDYLPVVFTRWAGFELMNYSPLIYAIDCENIAITGPGKLFGHGQSWWGWEPKEEETGQMIYKQMVLENIPPEERIFGKPAIGLRPQLINPVRCRNVLLEGFTIAQPGPFWTIHFYLCENVIVRRLNIHTKGGPNTDGINLDSTRNALLEHCLVDAEDDTVCIKSGMNEDGWRVGRPTENVVIRNMTSLQGHGGVVIGSEMSGDVRNVLAHDCIFDGTGIGIRLKSNASRGGIVEKIWYKNIHMKNIVNEAISINTDYNAWMSSINGKAFPIFRHLEFHNIICDQAGMAVNITGKQEQPIESILMRDVSFKAEKGLVFQWVNDLKLVNLKTDIAKDDPVSFLNCQAYGVYND